MIRQPIPFTHVEACADAESVFARGRIVQWSVLGIAALVMGMAGPTYAASGTWTVDADGNWSTAANWSGTTIADGAVSTADFSQVDITDDRIVTLDSDRTLGQLKFGDNDTATPFDWTVAGSSTLTLSATGTPIVEVINQMATIEAGVAGTQGLLKTGLGTLALTNANTGFSGTVTIDAGTLQLSGVNGALGGLTSSNAIIINNGATLNLDNSGGVGSINNNRLPDNTPITLNGGTLLVSSPITTDTSETVGPVKVGSGQSTIRVNQFQTSTTNKRTLTLSGTAGSGFSRADAAAVTKDQSTVIYFVGDGNRGLGSSPSAARIIIPGHATGFLGGWALARSTSTGGGWDFAYYSGDTDGVRAIGNLAGTRVTTFTGATATSDVQLTTASTLTGNLTIHTLIVPNATTSVDLGGNTLTLDAGGMLKNAASGTVGITNGTLTVGNADPIAPYTLYVHTLSSSSAAGISISVDIVDNGSNAVTLVKGGHETGILALSGVNTYTGGTILNAGTLRVDNSTALPSNGDVTIYGGTFSLSGTAAPTIGDLTGNDLGAITLPTGGTLTINQTGTTTYAGTISASAAGKLVKTGSGTLVLTSANSFGGTGALTISGGVLRVEHGSAMGVTSGTAYTLTNSGSRLEISGVTLSTGTNLITLDDGTEIRGLGTAQINPRLGISDGATITLSTAAASDVFTVGNGNGDISGTTSAMIHVSGPGTVAVNVSNNTTATFSGSWLVNSGTLRLGSDNALGDPIVATATINSDATLSLSGSSRTIGHTLTFDNATLVNGTTSTNSGSELTGNVMLVNGSTNTVLQNNANAGAPLKISGEISGGGGLVKTGVGTLELSSASNTYAGTTTIHEGTLHITGTLTSGGGVVAVETAGTLQSSSLTSILRNVTVTGNGTLSFAGGSIGGTLTATGGTWTGNGSVGGAITINPGTFTLSSGGTITASGLTTINASGILSLGGTLSGSASLAGGTISGSGGTITGTLAVSGGTWSGTGTISGAITATSGTFEVLSGATLNNLSSATVTSSGTLSVNGLVTGSVIVNNGGTLHGNGTIEGPVTVNSGGNLSAGNSVGHLTVDDDMTWNSGSNQTFEISDADVLGTPGTDWDLITVNGELTLNATPSSKINLKFDSWPPGDTLDNFDALDNYSWLWITATGGIDVSGQPVNDLFNITLGPEFAGDFPLVDPTKFNVSLSLDGLNMFVNYTINVVPEPGTLLLTSLAAASIGWYGRHRRRKVPLTSTT